MAFVAHPFCSVPGCSKLASRYRVCSSHSRSGGFSTSEAIRFSGASLRQVDYWARTGLVVPSIAEAHGSGSRRRWSLEDLVCLRALVTLLSAGWFVTNGRTLPASGDRGSSSRHEVLEAVVRAIRSAPGGDGQLVGNVLLVVDNGSAHVVVDGPELEAALGDFEHAVAIWIPDLLVGLDAAA